MIRARTDSVGATRALGGALASLVQAGDVVLLVGDLGAGKTALTQGFAEGLGITVPITSPTFTLHNQYQGRLILNHLDVYRLDQAEEAIDLALPELLDAKAVAVVEWGDTIVAALGPDYLEVRLSFPAADQVAPDDSTEPAASAADDGERHLELRCVGPGWSARSRSLVQALASWVQDGEPC